MKVKKQPSRDPHFGLDPSIHVNKRIIWCHSPFKLSLCYSARMVFSVVGVKATKLSNYFSAMIFPEKVVVRLLF